jgi:hypothetical protein
MENEKLFEERLKELERRMASEPKKTYVLFCPVCGSTNVKHHFYGLGREAAVSPQMNCKDCGFYGFMVAATLEALMEYRKILKRRHIS